MSHWTPRELMRQVMEAVDQPDERTWVFYITGPGGQGKTILQREIGQALGSEDGTSANERWSGILDVYHADINTNSGMEASIAAAFETRDKEFELYRLKRDDYLDRRAQGMPAVELEALRHEVSKTFADSLNLVTNRRRLVIALDTVERIQYQVDEVQRRLGYKAESTLLAPWLFDQLRRWRNCVVVLTGREREDFALDLQTALSQAPEVRYVPLTLTHFSPAEVEDYYWRQVDAGRLPVIQDLSPSQRAELYQYTGGRPVQLDLILEIAQHHGIGFDQLMQDLRRLSQEQPEKRDEKIDEWLIDQVMNNEPEAETRLILHFLAAARKGLHAPLLAYLTGWPEQVCEARLAQIETRSFVKKRIHRGQRWLFLHDEVYDLCDRRLDITEVRQTNARLLEWYDQQIRAAKARSMDAASMDPVNEMRVEALLYRFRHNPREGNAYFVRAADQAIRNMAVGYVMGMRNEALAFLTSQSPVDRAILRLDDPLRRQFRAESAVRLVKQALMRGRYDETIELANRLLALTDIIAPHKPGNLARAELHVLLGEALAYQGQADAALAAMQEALDGLEQGRLPAELAIEDAGTYEGDARNRTLGRCHNNIGYVYWTLKQQYKHAILEFEHALVYFRASDLEEETANTSDNKGRVHALLQEKALAEAHVDDGLALRRKLGLKYREALSLNSRALVFLHFGHPIRGEGRAREALTLFEQYGGERGRGLAQLTLGRCLRHRGMLAGREESMKGDAASFYERAETHLTNAVNIFGPQGVGEMVPYITALNELGCACREHATLKGLGQAETPEIRILRRRAITTLEECLRLTKEKGLKIPYMDACEDLAQVYYRSHDRDEAERRLALAEETAPEEYKIRRGGQPGPPKGEEIEEFWLQLGKIALLRGHIVFQHETGGGRTTRAALEKSLRHFAFAFHYFTQFSKTALGIETTLLALHDRFKRGQIQDLQYLLDETLPSLCREYVIDVEELTDFLEDTLGLSGPVYAPEPVA